MSETAADMTDNQAWAEVIGRILSLLANDDQRKAVLQLALQQHGEKVAHYNAICQPTESGLRSFRLADIGPYKVPNETDIPSMRTPMLLNSLVVQVLVRDINVNHSPKRAAQILFAQHHYGHGSGMLADYLEGLR